MPSILAFPGDQPVTTTNSFSTIQPDLGTSPVASSPTDTLTLTSSDSSVLITGTAGTDTINFQVSGTATGLNAQFLTLATSAGLANERVFTPGTSLTATDGGAGGTYSLNTIQDIRTSASPTWTGLTLSGLGLGVVHSSSGGVFSSSLIVNADVSATAAIAYSKLNLTGSIVNADINAAAAIAYSKLNLTGSIVNADINAAAAIAYSKLNLALSIVNADIAVGAAIAYAKLNLTASIVNADIAAAAAIARTKIASGTANHVIINDGSGVLSSEATLAVSRGGTNIGSYTAGDIIYASASTTFTQVPIGASGTLLRSTGSAPAWATLSTAGIASNTEAYVTIGNTAGLTAERALTAGTAISIVDGGANSTVTINNTGVTSNIAGTGISVSGATGAVTITNAGVTSLIATANQTTVSGATGAVTIGTVQSIGTGSSPTFTGLTLSGLTSGSVLFAGTAGVISQDNTNFFYDSANTRLRVPNIASGTSSGGNLTLTSTTDPAKGKIILDDEISLWPSYPTAAAATGVLFSPSTIALNNYAAQLMDLSPTITFAGAVPIWSTIKSTVTCSIDTSTSFQFYSFQQAGTFTSTQKPIFFTFNLFLSAITFTTATAAKPPIAPIAFMCQNIIQVTANAAGTLGGDILSFSSSDTFQATAAAATATATNMTSFKSLPILKSSNATSAITVTNLRNFHAVVPTLTTTGALTITNSIGLDFENQSQTSGNLTVGTIAAVRSAQNVSSGGTAAWAILAIGTAASSFAGPIRIGDNTAPTAALDISGAQANHIRMAGSTSAPASPTAGDIYYDTTQKTHKEVTTIGTKGVVGLINANTADSSAITNTTTETNFSLNFSCAANSLTVGKVIRIKGSGIYTSILTPTLQFKVKYGTVTLIDFGAISAGTAVTNRAFEIDMMFVVRTIGATGTVMATGNIFMDNAASVVVTGTATCANNAGTTTIDTTAATNLQISATWSAASLTNTTTLENFIVEALG